jgi:hypothetical protein
MRSCVSVGCGIFTPGIATDTLVRIASMTRSFKVMARFGYRDAGKLSLDDPVERSERFPASPSRLAGLNPKHEPRRTLPAYFCASVGKGEQDSTALYDLLRHSSRGNEVEKVSPDHVWRSRADRSEERVSPEARRARRTLGVEHRPQDRVLSRRTKQSFEHATFTGSPSPDEALLTPPDVDKTAARGNRRPAWWVRREA